MHIKEEELNNHFRSFVTQKRIFMSEDDGVWKVLYMVDLQFILSKKSLG